MSVKIEICAGSIESAIAAKKGGADRIELCSALSEGGLTPSQAMIEYSVNQVKIDTYVLIRPRNGDFYYSRAEYELIKSDIFAAKLRGAAGVVIGMLNSDGTIDSCRLKELVEMARPMGLTFHRAFDVCNDPFIALEEIIKLGFDRILTSGHALNAMAGSALLADLVKQAGDRIIIMPGGGITAANLKELHRITGASEFHTSASGMVPSKMHYRNPAVSMGGAGEDEYSIKQTDPDLVQEVCWMAREL